MRWAVDSAAERAAFEAFIDELLERWERYPDLHVYHFAPYEPGAIKRLMGRYATREDEIDRILRAELFVDLHSIARQSLRAAVERYSIKDLEQFYRFKRATELRDASQNLRALEHALELGRTEAVPEAGMGGSRGVQPGRLYVHSIPARLAGGHPVKPARVR